MTAAARFNAREEWAKADALYGELEDMCVLGAASPAAIAAARSALRRAVGDAEVLAPITFVLPPTAQG